MSQVTLYLDDRTAQRMREAAESEGLSQSQRVARLVRARLDESWPSAVRELAGTWPDFPNQKELREGQGTDVPREPF